MAELPPLPAGFTLDAPAAQAAVPPLPSGFTLDSAASPTKVDVGRQLGLVGRAAAEGVVNTLALPLDMQEQMTAVARDAILSKFGVHLPDMTISGLLQRGLNTAGAETPQTPGEQMGSAVTRGITGALAGGAAGGAMTATNALRAGVSGATGSGASELARQKGFGPGAQMVAGLAGGLTPGVIEGAGRTAMNVIRPLTASGQQRIAGEVLANQAQDPAAAAQRLQGAKEIVPGSARTTGEASGDVGMLALEKGVRGRSTADFAQRTSEQNAARQAALSNVAGSPADIAAAQTARNAETGAMREAALGSGGQVAAQPVIAHIDTVLASPIGKRDIPSAALNWVRGKIEGEANPANLYAVRQDIGDALAGKLSGDQAKFRLARKELLDVRSTLDDAIEQAAPGFKAYLARYSELSKPIDQMKVMQEIQRRSQLTAADVTTGENFLGTASFSRALDAAVQKKGAQLSPRQLEQLNAIRTDMQYGQAINGPLIKAPGSDTFQNLSIAQAIGAGGKKIPGIAAVITKPLDWVYKLAGTDAAVNEALTRAMLDPKLAALMLQRATPQSMTRVSNALRAYGIGAGAGAASSRSAPSTSESNRR